MGVLGSRYPGVLGQFIGKTGIRCLHVARLVCVYYYELIKKWVLVKWKDILLWPYYLPTLIE
jgi:hypothetical protein